MSHMTQRQLHRLWAFRMRMGRVASRVGDDDRTGASCSAGMVHLLSTETDISTYYFSCLGEQAVDGSSQPALMAGEVDRLQARFEEIGAAFGERRARMLASSG